MNTRGNTAVVDMELRIDLDAFDAEMRQWAGARWSTMPVDGKRLVTDLYVRRVAALMQDNWRAGLQAKCEEALRDVLDGLGEADGAKPHA